MTKKHPILFNAEMVRQILKGDKTQTRRVLKTTHDAFEAPKYRRGDVLFVADDPNVKIKVTDVRVERLRQNLPLGKQPVGSGVYFRNGKSMNTPDRLFIHTKDLETYHKKHGGLTVLKEVCVGDPSVEYVRADLVAWQHIGTSLELRPANLQSMNDCFDRYIKHGYAKTIAEAALISVLDDFILSVGTRSTVATDELRMLVAGNIEAIRARTEAKS